VRELFREFAAARLRAQDDHRRQITLAWHIVHVYVKTKANKRLPGLKELLRAADPPAPQTAPQMFAALQVLSQQYGIPIRERQVS
jgi:hypothetical protein